MAYNQNIPQPADQIKNSQPQILANFQEINTALAVNHVGFNDADQGKHKFIQFPRQVATPATAPTETALFSKIGEKSGESELNFVRQDNGIVIPFTESLINPDNGWTFYPSGFLCKWGYAAVNAGVGTGATFSITFPILAEQRAFTSPPYFVNFVPSSNGVLANGLKIVTTYDYTSSTALTINGSFYSISGNWPDFRMYYYAIGTAF